MIIILNLMDLRILDQWGHQMVQIMIKQFLEMQTLQVKECQEEEFKRVKNKYNSNNLLNQSQKLWDLFSHLNGRI